MVRYLPKRPYQGPYLCRLRARFDLNFLGKEASMLLILSLGGTMPDSSISQRLASLPTLSKPALCELWHQLFKREPPPVIRKNLLLRIVAHRLQELEFGGLSDAACRRLRRLATAFEANPNAAVSTRPRIKPGTRLVRQWKEKVHVVEVEGDRKSVV